MATELKRAAADGDISTVRRLVESEGVDVNGGDLSGYPPIFSAAVYGQDEIVAYLLSKGADPNKANDRGTTPLMGAAMNNQASIVRYLLAHGADGTLKDIRGMNAADRAYQSESKDVLPILESAGILVQPEKHAQLARWIGTPPYNPDPQIYLLAGAHGCEDIGFDDRATLPPGYKLIVYNKSGCLTFVDETYIQLVRLLIKRKPELDAVAKDNFLHIEDTFEDLKTMLDAPMSLYLPGDKYPNLHYSPFLGLKENTMALASGVRKFPIDKTTIFQGKQALKSFPLSGSEDELTEIYKESLYPTAETAQRIFLENDKNYSHFTTALKISVKEVMERLGPGVYIYLACRSPSCEFPISNIVEKRHKENSEKFGVVAKNVPGRYEEILTLLGSKNDPVNRAVVQKILLTRQKSEEQQAKRGTRNTGKATAGSGTSGGRRKTRRRRRRSNP